MLFFIFVIGHCIHFYFTMNWVINRVHFVAYDCDDEYMTIHLVHWEVIESFSSRQIHFSICVCVCRAWMTSEYIVYCIVILFALFFIAWIRQFRYYYYYCCHLVLFYALFFRCWYCCCFLLLIAYVIVCVCPLYSGHFYDPPFFSHSKRKTIQSLISFGHGHGQWSDNVSHSLSLPLSLTHFLSLIPPPHNLCARIISMHGYS